MAPSDVRGKIFISYRRDDSSDAAERIFERLEAHFGRDRVFLDIDIPKGEKFNDFIVGVLNKCGVLLAIIGDEWTNISFADGPNKGQRRLDDPADYVRREIETALRAGIRVIPVLVQKAMPPSPKELPERLKSWRI